MPTLHDKLVQWVADRSDGEFFVNDETRPLHEMEWTDGPAIYAPKRRSLLGRLTGEESKAPVAVLGTYGIPTGERHAWLREALRSGDVYFFGDLVLQR